MWIDLQKLNFYFNILTFKKYFTTHDVNKIIKFIQKKFHFGFKK